ncbi:MAG: hypothetical protein AAB410_02530, partial [Patescibacteria group bacterium]
MTKVSSLPRVTGMIIAGQPPARRDAMSRMTSVLIIFSLALASALLAQPTPQPPSMVGGMGQTIAVPLHPFAAPRLQGADTAHEPRCPLGETGVSMVM